MRNPNLRHIALFTAFYPPHMGGVERYSVNLAEELVRQGYQVTIITSACGEKRPEHEAITILEIPSTSIMNDRFPLPLPTAKTVRTIKELMAMEVQAIIIQTRYYPISLIGCIFARKRNLTPLVIDHSSGPLSREKNLIGALLRGYERAITHVVRKFCPVFSSVSTKGVEWLGKLGISAKGVTPNSIDCERFIGSSSNKDWRSSLGCGNKMLVLFAGRLIAEKGVSKLLAAAQELNNMNVPIHFAIAGSGPLENEVKNANLNNVSFVGKLNQNDLSSLMHAADVFCLPSDYPEGLPTVLLEASAQHCALIMSQTGGTEELVPNEYYGIVLSNTSKVEICKALMFLLNNPEKLEQFKSSSFENVKKNFSWSCTVNSILKLF